jgi:hypothetical protein
LRTAISLFCAPYEAFVRCQDENRDVVEFNLLFEKMSADKATAVTQMDLEAEPPVSAPALEALIAAAVNKRVEARFKQLSQQKKAPRGAGLPSTQTNRPSPKSAPSTKKSPATSKQSTKKPAAQKPAGRKVVQFADESSNASSAAAKPSTKKKSNLRNPKRFGGSRPSQRK